jgi:fructose-1,6-bisphosphatase/inositol monophosphatase family enzyme
MNYKQHENTRTKVIDFFKGKEDQFPGVADALQNYFDDPTLAHAREATKLYAKSHQQGSLDPLNMFALAFAEKRLTVGLINSIIDDPEALDYIAQRSYPHPIGFDKLVLYQDPDTGFKFRLHIYWRGNQRADMERTHLHRFEMASAIITGELTNHEWETIETDLETDLISGIEAKPSHDSTSEQQRMAAYTGYWRDPEGVLHKQYLGHVKLQRATSLTHVSGKSYAQELDMAHYVETNAEKGTGNGDVCSTIYIHSGGKTDKAGRKIPILFEEFRLASDDEIIEPIPNITRETLRSSLEKYRDLVQQSIEFYDWLYDPKHGRNLSVGMIAGYLLSDSYSDPHIVKTWIEQEGDCKKTLEEYSTNLERLIRSETSLSDMSDDDRKKRYYALLLDKAHRHEAGLEDWYNQYGNLIKEMWRYCGAIKGEKPDVTVLKPIWENVVGKKMPGGAHYGHIAAMIDAAYRANNMALEHLKADTIKMTIKSDGSPVSVADVEIQADIETTLSSYYPDHYFKGEESPDAPKIEYQNGDKRWLVDPIDGTRNFLNRSDNFCISIACQEFQEGQWTTTDAVVSIPSTSKILWAEKGKGAYIIEANNVEKELKVSAPPLSANDNKNPLERQAIDLSITGLGVEGEASLICSIRASNGKYRTTGSAAMTLAGAAGRGNNGAVVTANDYDIAAGKLIAEEAGATVSEVHFNHSGEPIIGVIAGQTPDIHNALRNVVLSIIEKKPAISMKLNI